MDIAKSVLYRIFKWGMSAVFAFAFSVDVDVGVDEDVKSAVNHKGMLTRMGVGCQKARTVCRVSNDFPGMKTAMVGRR
jgi:hypothetical protein